MPAKNPRLTITLQPVLAAQLRRLSELTGNSQSALIAELLEGSEPIFTRMIQVLEAAEQAKGVIKGKLASDLAEAETKMTGQLGLILDTFDDFTGDLLEEAEKVKRRAARTPRGGDAAPSAPRRAASVRTPLSNRGVRSDPKKAKKPIKTGG